MVTGDDVRAAGSALHALLEAVDPDGWDVQAGVLDWTVRQTTAHITDCLLWYAGNLALQSTSRVGGPDLDAGANREDQLDGLRFGTAVLATVVDAADETARGWHPAGIADRSGFAAMGCDEILVHGYDIGRGLGVPFTPPAEPAASTLRRLFPWAPDDADPWAALLWCNGREPLGDTPPPGTEWVWHCAPLDEWSGTIPTWG